MIFIILWFYYIFNWMSKAVVVKVSAIYGIVIFFTWLHWSTMTYYAAITGYISKTWKVFGIIKTIIAILFG
jgi:hypothetical protein